MGTQHQIRNNDLFFIVLFTDEVALLIMRMLIYITCISGQ